jgi:hypothetical protein
VSPTVSATSHTARQSTIHAAHCPTQKTYSVCRMIFRPRVAPRYVWAIAAKGRAAAAARKAFGPPGSSVNSRAMGPARTKTTTPAARLTSAAMATDRATSPRARACAPRPARMATSRTLATSIPKRVAAAPMNAACTAAVTTP